MTQDMNPKKPEWFELVDSDAPSAQVTRINRVLPAMAVLVSGAVIATGAFFASASESEEGQSQVLGTSINQVENSSPAAVASESVATSEPTVANVATSNPPSASPAAPALQNPTQGGVKVPGSGGDDDEDEDEDDDDDDEHEGRKRHKEREH